MKVHIRTTCSFCDGEAYSFVVEDVDAKGQTFDRYRPCELCHNIASNALLQRYWQE